MLLTRNALNAASTELEIRHMLDDGGIPTEDPGPSIDIVYERENANGDTAEEALTDAEWEQYQKVVNHAADIWDRVLNFKTAESYEINAYILSEEETDAAGGGAPTYKNSDGLYNKGRMALSETLFDNVDDGATQLYVALHEMGHAFDLYDTYEGDSDYNKWKLMAGIAKNPWGYAVYDSEFDGIEDTTIMHQASVFRNDLDWVASDHYRLKPSMHGLSTDWDK